VRLGIVGECGSALLRVLRRALKIKAREEEVERARMRVSEPGVGIEASNEVSGEGPQGRKDGRKEGRKEDRKESGSEAGD